MKCPNKGCSSNGLPTNDQCYECGALDGRDGWISVNDRLPESEEVVLWYDKMFNNIDMFGLYEPRSHDGDYTHWMPLPQPPSF